MKRVLAFLLFLMAGERAFAQMPDCVQYFNFTAVGNTATVDNRQIGCVGFVVVYESSGFSAISLVFQGADGATAAGSFGTFSGVVQSGANPSTNTTSNTTVMTGYQGWTRMRLASATGSGTVRGAVYGYKQGFAATITPVTSGCPGTVGTPCVVIGNVAVGAAPSGAPLPLGTFDGTNTQRLRSDTSGRPIVTGAAADGSAIAGNPLPAGVRDASGFARFLSAAGRAGATANTGTDQAAVVNALYNGATYDQDLKCPSTVIVDDSASGNTQLIALSGSTKIYVCKMTLTAASTVDIQLKYGTGSVCATGIANLSGLYQQAIAVAEDFLSDHSALTTPAGQALCLNLGSGVRVTGMISYVQF